MAEGARRAAGTDLGGRDHRHRRARRRHDRDKPVGLVFLALAGAAGDRVRRAQFPGDRDRVRAQAAQAALEMVRRAVLGLGARRSRAPSAPSSRSTSTTDTRSRIGRLSRGWQEAFPASAWCRRRTRT